MPQYTPSEGSHAATLDGVTVVLSPNMDFVELDETGTVIWEALQHHCEAPAIAEVLVERFTVDHDTARRDVTRFLEQLRDAGLVTVTGP